MGKDYFVKIKRIFFFSYPIFIAVHFHWKKINIFLIFAQNRDCEYTLEPPRRGGSKKYPQSRFWSKNKNQRTNGPINAHLRSEICDLS